MSQPPLRVFLTGASSGIGEALAWEYARNGAQLGLVARRSELIETLRDKLPGGESQHMAITASVGDEQAMRAAAEAYMARFGLPDIVIANAGISIGTLTEEALDYRIFETILRTNVLGMVATFQPFVETMRKRGSGRLVGISSVAGVRGLPGAGAYSASKAAASRYLESLRVELRGSGVKVVDLRPGYIHTPMTARNPYPMPFIIDADNAARRFVRVIAAGRSQATIPWQMNIVAKLLAHLPNALYDFAFARAGRKPRNGDKA